MNNSAVKVIQILEFLASSPTPLGVSEISRALGYAKSSVFDILAALIETKMIAYADEAAKTYQIGLKSFQIGSVYLKNTGLHNAAKPVMERLSRVTGETVFLAVEQDGFILYLDKVTGTSPVVFMCEIGAKNLMQVTGIGKAMLAGYSDDEIARLVGDKLQKRTQNSLSELPALLSEMASIRQNGYAIDNGEDVEVVRCVGAPVRDYTGKVVAGISVSMLEQAFIGEKKEKTIHAVTQAAFEISQKLGYAGDRLYADIL